MIAGKLIRQGFDSYIALPLGVPRPIDFTIPPAPIRSTISYCPSFVPGFNAIEIWPRLYAIRFQMRIAYTTLDAVC
jgi:hypothetical protein